MIGDKKLSNGHKARQRDDCVNRELPFSDALRTFGICANDVDFLITDGNGNLKLMVEVTAASHTSTWMWNYLGAVDERRWRQNNDLLSLRIAKMLGVRAILVVFAPDIETDPSAILYWRWVDGVKWHMRNAQDFFCKLKDFAHK